MSAESLSVTAASRFLGISPKTIKRLCEDGRLSHFSTPGGHFRFRRSDLDEFSRNGNSSRQAAGAGTSSVQNRREHVEELVLSSKELRAQRELRQLEAEDQRAEEQRQAEAQALALKEKRELELLRLESERAADARKQKERESKALRQRRKWEIGWTEYALKLIPQDAPRNIALEVHEEILEILSRFEPQEQPRQITERLVRAAVEKALEPCRRRKEIEKIITDAPDQLPWLARGAPTLGEPSQWYIRAQHAAADAIARLEIDAPLAKVRATAAAAANAVTREYQAAKADDEHRQACHRLAESVFLFGGTSTENQTGREAVKEALSKLPVGMSHAKLEQVKNEALAPFRAAISERQAATQAIAQAEQFLRNVRVYVTRIAMLDKTGGLGLTDPSSRDECTEDFKQHLRPILIDKLKQQSLTQDQADELIENWIDQQLGL